MTAGAALRIAGCGLRIWRQRSRWLVCNFVIGALAVSAAAAEPVALNGRAMGTTWTIKFVPPGVVEPEDVRQHAADRLDQLEQQFSTYRPDAEVKRFNATGTTGWVEVSREFAYVASLASEISALTDGAFDVTLAPLIELWGFGPERRLGAPPDVAAIRKARSRVDWRALDGRLHPPAVRKRHPDVAVDFSSIAKGRGVDLLSDWLTSKGARNHFVQIGGDMKTCGPGPTGIGWHVGIEQPRLDQPAIALVLQLSAGALSTSGNYRNFVTLGRERFGHIIDPRSGRPVENGLAAVSVVHPSCAWSSALATGLFVLGPDEGRRLAEREDLAAVFFVRNGDALEQRMTPKFERLVKKR